MVENCENAETVVREFVDEVNESAILKIGPDSHSWRHRLVCN